MKAHSTPIPGLILVELKVYKDDRGFFAERFRADKFKEMGIDPALIQDNHSRSAPGVLRGLHYQSDPPQGKLISTIRGRIWDVAVDLRKGSPTRGKYFSVELSDENGLMLWVPYGFAHGFCVLGQESADVVYKVNGYYNPKTEGGILWNDPDLNVDWPVKNPIVSARDNQLSTFRETFLPE